MLIRTSTYICEQHQEYFLKNLHSQKSDAKKIWRFFLNCLKILFKNVLLNKIIILMSTPDEMMAKARPEPQQTLTTLIQTHYHDACAAFWAGSVSHGAGTKASDLDLVLIKPSVAHAYRDAMVVDGWPVDVFIHDCATLHYFCHTLEANDGRPALIRMILDGISLLPPHPHADQALQIAQDAWDNGPTTWNQEHIDRERFLITDILDDILNPASSAEQIASAIHLYEPLLQFWCRAQKKWSASGKALQRLMMIETPDLTQKLEQAFVKLVHTGQADDLEVAVKSVLAPYGGLLWEGFHADAPAGWRKNDRYD